MYLDVTVLLESLNITAILEQAIFNNSHTKGETASGSAIAAYPCLNGKARMPPGWKTDVNIVAWPANILTLCL